MTEAYEKQKNPFINRGLGITLWRRRRDSNPRYAINVYTLSRGAPSATRPLLRDTLDRIKIECFRNNYDALV